MSEREKDSFSEMEDDDKYIKSDSDNESDKDKGEKNTKFKNLKVSLLRTNYILFIYFPFIVFCSMCVVLVKVNQCLLSFFL